MSDSLQAYGLQPTRLLCPWHSPGKKTGVGCHFLLQGIFLTQGIHVSCTSHIGRQVLYRKDTWASLVAQMVRNLPAVLETWVWSLSWEDLIEEGLAIHSSTFALRITMDRGAWWATVHWVKRVGHGWVTKQSIPEKPKEAWTPKNWCFWAVVLEKTLQSPLDRKEIKNKIK